MLIRIYGGIKHYQPFQLFHVEQFLNTIFVLKMNDFELFIKTGLWHIANINAYDHIVFVIALCASYYITDWRRILLLITAFTIGHSLTLGLSVLEIVVFPSQIIELLIPVTILISSILNIKEQKTIFLPKLKYGLALFFGFIHG
jgi:hypothetical protein